MFWLFNKSDKYVFYQIFPYFKKYKDTIKKILYEEYSKYLEDYSDKIIDILILEGKQMLGRQVKSDELTFINFITTDNYFLTALDILVLADQKI